MYPGVRDFVVTVDLNKIIKDILISRLTQPPKRMVYHGFTTTRWAV